MELKVESKFRQAEKILVQLPSISVVSPNTLNQINLERCDLALDTSTKSKLNINSMA